MAVIGETDNGQDAVALAKKTGPHVVIMDVAMPGLNGIEATRRIVHDNPRARVVALSAHLERRFVTEMLKAGASGYVLKQSASDELIRAIKEVIEGKTYLSPSVTQAVVEAYVRSAVRSDVVPAFDVLTEREREVLQLTAEGRSTKEIAGHMGVSVKTVETHRHNLMQKLDLRSIADLTRYAIREGVTSLEV